MAENRIVFGKFEFFEENGLEYVVDEEKPETDFLFVNDAYQSFSMYFEKDFPIFAVPENSERDYCLFELKRLDRIIKFFCPEKKENLDAAVWYFYVEIFDEKRNAHTLPGQVRVEFDGKYPRFSKGKPKFIGVLEKVQLYKTDIAV